MTGPLLAAGAFVALLVLGWWQRRRVPLVHVVQFVGDVNGDRWIEVDYGGTTVRLRCRLDALDDRREW